MDEEIKGEIGKEKVNENQKKYDLKKRMNSDANMVKFQKDIIFGPEFICACCHGCLFEKEVLEFTDERKKNLSKRSFLRNLAISCDFQEEIQNITYVQ